jgi:hypothetical protein
MRFVFGFSVLALVCLAISPAISHPVSFWFGDRCGYGEGYGCGYGYSPGYYAFFRGHYGSRYSPLYTPRVTRYESCSCHYGYEDGYSLCTPAVSCEAEGGRCRAPCAAQTGN